MIDISDQIMDIVKVILKTHVPECEVRVFGSRINGNAKNYSDLDLAIVGTEKLPAKVLMELKEAFEESVIPFRVDILDWNGITDSFKSVIEQKYEII